MNRQSKANNTNREPNHQMDYNHALDALHFSEEAKAAMARKLMDHIDNINADQKNTARQVCRSIPRFAAVGVAAALVLTAGAGATVVYNKLASESFAGVFGSAHTEIVDSIGRPVGASDTDHGVTITADAIIGDKYHYAITYTIARDDGAPFDIDLNATVGNGVLPLMFEQSDVDIGWMSGEHGSSYFYDADPDDNAIQYVEMRETDAEVLDRTAKAVFKNLKYLGETEEEHRIIAEGEWKIKFDLNFEDVSVNPSAGQTFELNGMNVTLDEITLSPIALRVDYTVDSEAQWDKDAQSGRESEHNSSEIKKYLQDMQILINKKDGTVIDMGNCGGSVKPRNGRTVCQKGDLFNEVIPLEDMQSLTIGGIEISVN